MAARPQRSDVSESETGERAGRVAVLDRDVGLLLVLENRLQAAGWERLVLRRVPKPETLAEQPLDALVVDVALVGAAWLDWLTALCARCPELPVLVCTSASSVADRVYGLRAGAADWLAKPCHPEELIARLEAITLAHRGEAPRDLKALGCGEVEIRPDLFQAFVAGRSLALTRREYGVLELLARADGEPVTREAIYEAVWRREMVDCSERAVDVFVHKLREKLRESSPRLQYIHTEFRIGYRMSAEPLEGVPVLAAADERKRAAAAKKRERQRRVREPLAA